MQQKTLGRSGSARPYARILWSLGLFALLLTSGIAQSGTFATHSLAAGLEESAPEAARSLSVESEIVRHDAVSLDDAGTRPVAFSYVGELRAQGHDGGLVTEDVFSQPVRLERSELVPDAGDDLPLNWDFAGRAGAVNVDVQDTLGVHVLTPARADTYPTQWFHRQETATDFWDWGGVLEGSQVHGDESSQNAVFGSGPRDVDYPEQDERPAEGVLMWEKRSVVEETVREQVDPVTKETYGGTFAGHFAVPSLRVEGGDLKAEQDISIPPLVLDLPVRPSGLVFYSTPVAPPGVEISWSRSLDFDAQTVTLEGTIHAGSVWPESGAHPQDPTLPTWTWTPWVFFMGWDYGDAALGQTSATGASLAMGPARLRDDGTLEVERLGEDGFPLLPAGLLDADLPEGVHVELASGAHALLEPGRYPGAGEAKKGPGVHKESDLKARSGSGKGAPQPPEPVERDGVFGYRLNRGGDDLGELYVAQVRVSGVGHRLDEGNLLDRFTFAPESEDGSGTWYTVLLHEVDGLFLSLVVMVVHSSFSTRASYFLWDAHSVDSVKREVTLQVFLDPEIGDGSNNRFVEPFYTGETYPVEARLAQGVPDMIGIFAHGWLGSLPAIEVRDEEAPGGILFQHHSPMVTQQNLDAAHTAAYLLVDDGSFPADPLQQVQDPEPIAGADVVLVLENRYEGTLWDRDLLFWFSDYVY